MNLAVADNNTQNGKHDTQRLFNIRVHTGVHMGEPWPEFLARKIWTPLARKTTAIFLL